MEILAGVLDDKAIHSDTHKKILLINAKGTPLKAYLDEFIQLRE